MLESPDLSETRIADWLLDHYGLRADNIEFLPTGYQNAAAYRVVADNRKTCFLKLKRDPLDETSITVPLYLKRSGIQSIISPLATRSGQYWADLGDFTGILYPFVDGQNAFQAPLSDEQWFQFGATLRQIHDVVPPSGLVRQLPRELYSRACREKVKALLQRARTETFKLSLATQLAELLNRRANEIFHLVKRAEQLAKILTKEALPLVLCHSDIHAGNLFCSTEGHLYLVDWDNPILAPKERDLMFIGGGIGGVWNTDQEEALFYRGYGKTKLDPRALTYYRFERILEDIGPFAEHLFSREASNPDDLGILQGTADFFQPNAVVEMAYRAEKSLPSALRSATDR